MALAPAELAGAPTVWGLPERYRVEARRRETPGVVTLSMRPLDEAAPRFVPGQFNMVSAFGAGEVPISIAGIDGSGAILHTIRDVGPVTKALCAVRPGYTLSLHDALPI